jgi:Protein of unknown function (DUF2934)
MKDRSIERPSDCTYQRQWISEAAYYKALNRNFESGFDLDDWLFAEHDFFNMLITRYLIISTEDGGMSMVGLRRLAKSIGVKSPETFTHKDELIRAIQMNMYHDHCFNSDVSSHCNPNEPCLWRAECKKMIAQWHN